MTAQVWVFFGLLVFLGIVMGFGVGYLIGRDVGSKTSVWYARLYRETLDKLNRAQTELSILRMASDRYEQRMFKSILDQIDDGPGPWSGQG
jgi:hypothetical protein